MTPRAAAPLGSAPPSLYDGPAVDIARFARRVLVVCVVTIGVLVALDIAITWSELIDNETAIALFNTADEENIPTWCSATFFFLTGTWAFGAWWGARRRGLSLGLRCGLILAACFFVFLGMDDTVELHERLGTIFTDMNGGEGAHASYGWQYYVLPFYMLVGGSVLLLVGPELRRRRLLSWFIAGGMLMAFAQGLDWVEGHRSFAHWAEQTAAAWGLDQYDISHPFRLLEETCEMLGVVFIGQAFLRLLAGTTEGMCLKLGSSG